MGGEGLEGASSERLPLCTQLIFRRGFISDTQLKEKDSGGGANLLDNTGIFFTPTPTTSSKDTQGVQEAPTFFMLGNLRLF